MKNIFCLVCLVVILAVTLHSDAKPHHQEHCECHYISSKKGCRIARGSSEIGYKCQCSVSSFFVWTHCVGSRIQCNVGEACAAGCLSKECCEAAGGDCNGY